MRALGVVMSLDRGQCSAQVGFAQQNQIIERFTNFSNMALGVRIAKRGMRGRFEDAPVVAFQYPIQGQKAGVAVMNQIPARQPPIRRHHRKVPGLLRHPAGVRFRRTASDPYPATAQVDEKQHVKGDQSAQAPNFFGKEVRRLGHLQVRLEELLPRPALAMGDRWQAMTPEHLAHVAGTGSVPELF